MIENDSSKEWMNVDMNQIVGSHHILFLCLDSLRYDVAKEEEKLGNTPVLNQYGTWQKCQAVGNFTYPAHQGMFAGFFPCYADAKKHKERIQLFFPENVGMGRKAPEGAYGFSKGSFVEALAEEGYETCCIGGVSFFDKRSGLGRVFPGYFTHSFWKPSYSPIVSNSTGNQIDFARNWLAQISSEQKIFMYINISAIHYPNYFYLDLEKKVEEHKKVQPNRSWEKDNKESHGAALRYVDKQLEPLFETFKEKGDTFVICCSDHGTCYGEDGCFSHGINHPIVNTIPYKHFIIKGEKKLKNIEIYQQYMYSYPHKTAYRTLENVDIREYLPRLQGEQENGLYFHIPFCEAKCGYCNLFSVTGKTTDYVDTYLDTMERQIEQYALDEYSFEDLTIGGGTPFYLEEKQLERLFIMAEKIMGERDYPIIMETSPNQTTEEKLVIAKERGTKRISLGIQSFWEEELKRVYRVHSPNQARNAIKAIKKQNFSCMNLDFIYGIQGQTKESLRETLKEGISYEPEELFVYPLYIKNGTLLKDKQEKRAEDTPMMYDLVCEFLSQNGYVQYSMRRFVRKGYTPLTPAEECGFGNTLSIGCGGRSYLGNFHFCTPYYVRQKDCKKQLDKYLSTKDFRKITHGFFLDKEEEKRRYIIKNLLFISGLDKGIYKEKFGEEAEKEFDLLDTWKEKGYVREENNKLMLTSEGMALSDYLGPQLISPKVKGRMQEWENRFFTEDI